MKKYDDKTLADLKRQLNRREEDMLSPLAVKNAHGIRRILRNCFKAPIFATLRLPVPQLIFNHLRNVLLSRSQLFIVQLSRRAGQFARAVAVLRKVLQFAGRAEGICIRCVIEM